MLWGDGTPTREFLYVDDAAEGILLAAERYDGVEPVNLGVGEETSIRELVELVALESPCWTVICDGCGEELEEQRSGAL